MNNLRNLVDKLYKEHELSKEEWIHLIEGQNEDLAQYVFSLARKCREPYYGHRVFLRGLIEISNYCKNDCFYCGIRHGNQNAHRYRLTQEEILACCEEGYRIGYRTFVLQGGEDPYYNDDRVVDLVTSIKTAYPDCALTLSIGEKSRESYKRYYQAGADRYLLRHETADDCHYAVLHPSEMKLSNRKRCLFDLKEIGFQVGAGFMVGSPGQSAKTLAEDMLFLKELGPHMVGIGPFIPHHDTPFANQPAGTLEQTLYLLGLVRIMLPDVLLPATTALGTIHEMGREMGMEAGANVVMPNLSPEDVRKDYLLYDNKLSSGEESAQNKEDLKQSMERIGYEIYLGRGDHYSRKKK